MSKTVLKQTEFARVSSEKMNGNIEILTITHPNCTASISVYAGHVLTWQPTGQKPVLWLSDNAEYSLGKAIRGGIPICWPWFGPKLDDSGTNIGSHGFARNNLWQLEHIDISEQAVELELTFSGENLHKHWSSPFVLKQTLTLGQSADSTLVNNERTASRFVVRPCIT